MYWIISQLLYIYFIYLLWVHIHIMNFIIYYLFYFEHLKSSYVESKKEISYMEIVFQLYIFSQLTDWETIQQHCGKRLSTVVKVMVFFGTWPLLGSIKK